MSDIQEEIRKLVLARLEMLPKDKKMSIGAIGELSRDQMIQHVKNDDIIGKKIMNIEMSFLQALKKGVLYD